MHHSRAVPKALPHAICTNAHCAGRWNWLREKIAKHLCAELQTAALGIVKERLLQDAFSRVAQHCRVQLGKLANQRPYGDAGPLKAFVRNAVDWHQNNTIENLRNEERDARNQLTRCARICGIFRIRSTQLQLTYLVSKPRCRSRSEGRDKIQHDLMNIQEQLKDLYGGRKTTANNACQ